MLHTGALHMAKRAALEELIRQMHKLEMTDHAEDMSEETDHPGMHAGYIEPDMSDFHDKDAPEVGLDGGDDGDEDDDRTKLENYMKHGSKMPMRGRVTVAVSAMKMPKAMPKTAAMSKGYKK